MLQCPPQPSFCSPRWPTSTKLNADLLCRTLPTEQGRTQNGGPHLEIFFLPLGSRYQNFVWAFFAAVMSKSNYASEPVITLNTMQNTAFVEKTDFRKKVQISIFGASPISPTPDVKVHFNRPRDGLKNAYLRSSLSTSGFPKLALIAFWGVGRPPVATPLIRSNLVPIERTP